MRQRLLMHAVISGLMTWFVIASWVVDCFGQEPVDLRIIHMDGLYAVSPEQVQEIYSQASYYFAQTGLVFRLQVIPMDYNPCIYKHSLVTREAEIKCFDPFRAYRRKIITFVMTPPFVTIDYVEGPRTTWIAGIAMLCKNLSTGNAQANEMVNDVVGGDMLPHSATILAHEVFHNMCATHSLISAKPNLMHPYANSYTSEYKGHLPIFRLTKRQVKRWYVKRRKHGTGQPTT